MSEPLLLVWRMRIPEPLMLRVSIERYAACPTDRDEGKARPMIHGGSLPSKPQVRAVWTHVREMLALMLLRVQGLRLEASVISANSRVV